MSRMFGIVLPLNFHSPYKSVNIIEFWQRWHITLSRFLKEYLYIPLGGNRNGTTHRYLNLMVVMILSGLWHGAGWTFVVWGALHGFYLVVNHGWQSLRKYFGQDVSVTLSKPMHAFAVVGTFLAVVVAWVIFRADSLHTANAMFKAMIGMNGFILPDAWLPGWGVFGQWLHARGISFGATNNLIMNDAIIYMGILFIIVWFTPNTQQIMGRFKPALDYSGGEQGKYLTWQPSILWAIYIFSLGLASIIMLSGRSEFLYFQF